MRHPLFFVICVTLAAAGTVLAQAAAAQPSPAAATERYRELMKLAREEVDRYAKSDAPRGGENDPRLRWAAKLWDLRTEYAGFPAGGNAARESVRLLVDAARIDEALARIDSLPASDPAWRAGLLTVLREAALQKGDAAIFTRRAAALLADAKDPEFRARVHYAAGRFHLLHQDRAQATAAFEAATAASPESEFGKRASREIHDLRALNLGQPAPAFSSKSLSGAQVSNGDLQGHATVFVYWASW